MDPKMFNWIKSLIQQDNLIPFYQCREWIDTKGEALERDHNECQECKRKGRYHAAEQVHHLKEVKQRPELALTIDNLESLCINCHNKAHRRFGKNKKPKWNDERW